MSENTELPTLDVDLLRDVVTWAVQDYLISEGRGDVFGGRLDHPEWGSWDQQHWGAEQRNGACKTAFCIAGQTVVQKGNVLLMTRDPNLDDDGLRGYSASLCASRPGVYRRSVTTVEVKSDYDQDSDLPTRGDFDNVETVEAKAMRLLGLHRVEQTRLFSGENGIEDVVSTAYCIAAIRGQALGLPDYANEFFTRSAAEVFWDCRARVLGYEGSGYNVSFEEGLVQMAPYLPHEAQITVKFSDSVTV